MEKTNKKQNFFSNLKVYAKTTTLAFTTLLTGISCGTTQKQQTKLDQGSYEYITDENVENNANTTTKITTKETKKETTQETTKEKEQIETKQTEISIENKTELKTETKKQEPSKENKTTTLIKNKDIHITTTQRVIETPRTEQPVTQQPVTEPPATESPRCIGYISRSERTDLTKYDMTSDDELDAKTILEDLSFELSQELFNGANQHNQYGVLPGVNAAYAIIVDLNYNQNINIKALGDRYDHESLEDFSQYIDNMNLAYYQYLYGTKVDFTKYTLDEELGQYINEVTDKYLDYKNSNNKDCLNEEFNNFFENNEPYYNYAKYYFMVNTKNENNYNNAEMNTARDIFNEGVTYPMYEEISQNMGKIKRKIYR